MKLNKNLLIAMAVTSIATGSIIGISAVSAHGGGENKNELVTKLAEKFNVDASEVESVFKKQHAEMKAEREVKRTERLQALVDAGTITAEQKTALEAKFEEMATTRQALKNQDLSLEEIHAKMDEGRSAIESWAKEQGINLKDIRPEGGQMGGRGHGFRD